MKKLTALLLSGLFAVSTTITATAAVVDYFVFNTEPLNVFIGRPEAVGLISNAQFDDIAGHWANEAIGHGAALGILNFGGGNFNPGQPITFQEGLGIAVNVAGFGEESLQAGLDFINDSVIGGDVFWDGSLTDTMHLGNLVVARDNDIISELLFNSLVGIPVFDVEAVQELLQDLQTAIDAMDAPPSEDNENDEIVDPEVAVQEIYDQLNAILGGIMGELQVQDPRDVLAMMPTRYSLLQRQDMARFIGRALSDNDAIQLPNQPRDILRFDDWQNISSVSAQYVEAFVRLGVMSGSTESSFNPTGTISRGEVAQIIRNLEDIYYEEQGISRNIGTVAGYRERQQAATLQGEAQRDWFIRRYDGDVDVIQHLIVYSPIGSVVNYDVPVFRNGQIGGLASLQVDDQIEYLTDGENVLYIHVIESGQNLTTVTGRLMDVDIINGTIRLRDDAGRDFTYNLTSGIFGEDESGQYLFMDERSVSYDDLPFGAFLELILINNLVSRVSFVGQPELVLEMRGIVIDNNPAFGYITVIDNNANIQTRFYNQNDMNVQRMGHYQTGGAGYIAQMFPHFAFNPLATTISAIQPGDIVFMRFDENDPTLITHISAVVHPVIRHGLVRSVNHSLGTTSVLLQFDNGQTSWFDIGENVFVTDAGRLVPNTTIQTGDRLRLLLNQVVMAPGHVVESILEVAVEAPGHHIGTILTGNFAGINNMQNQLMLQNSRQLNVLGWGPHTQIQNLNLNRQNIEFYHENQRISQEHAQRFFSRSDLVTYVALDQSPAGETIRQITFRDGRDELLNPELVISTDGTGGFIIGSIPGVIQTDSGTIVRSNGRQVSGSNISPGDLVRVSLNGGNNAAVVDIMDQPGVSAISVARVRILDVNEGNNFTVQSMATLQGHDWMFTPVERVFTITPNTLFLDEDGWVSPTNFIGFTEDTVIDRTFTVIYDGTTATHVIDAPYGNRVVRGQIFNVDANGNTGTLGIRDAQYLYNPDLDPTYQWRNISNANPVMNIEIPANSIIIRNNEIINPGQLQNGDQIRVLTHGFPEEFYPGVEIQGYIILVDR